MSTAGTQTTTTKRANAVQTLDDLLQSIATQGTKSAEAHTEPGGYLSPTTHPVKNVDDNTQEAEEGSRSEENEEDVKEQQGVAAVTPAKEEEAKSGGAKKSAVTDQDSVQMNIGLTSKATGEDSEHETASAKGGKEDGDHLGPSSHPARADSKDTKYSAARKKIAAVVEQGNQILADLASLAPVAKQAKAPATGAAPAKTEAAKAAGAELANEVAGEAQQRVAAHLDMRDTILSAYKAAHNVVEFLKSAAKQAEDDAPPPKDEGESSEKEESSSSEKSEESGSSEKKEEGSGGGGESKGPPAAPAGGDLGGGGGMGGAGGGMGGDTGAMILQALLGGALGGGAGGAGGGMPPGDPLAAAGGGAPPMDPMMAGGAGGGMPPGGGAIDPAMLQAVLAQEGISPQQMEVAAMAKAAKVLAERQKAAAALSNEPAKNAGNYKPRDAKEAATFKALTEYVRELVA